MVSELKLKGAILVFSASSSWHTQAYTTELSTFRSYFQRFVIVTAARETSLQTKNRTKLNI